MATNTYVALDKKTVASAVSSVTFTGIPQTYTDLELVVSGTDSAFGALAIQVGNGSTDTGAHYSFTLLYGTGSAAGSTASPNNTQMNVALTDTSAFTSIIKFFNYSNTTTYKTILGRGNATTSQVRAGVGLWRGSTGSSTQAIDTITVIGTSLQIGTTLSLYGIRAEGTSPAPKATGGAIYSDSTYYYHVFGSTGTFTPLQSLTCDYLVVAGGGGGAIAGGGAGGLRSTVGATGGGGSLESAISLNSGTAYTITVGAGGGAGIWNSTVSSNGNNSSIAGTGLTTITSIGGGAAGNNTSNSSQTNGSTGGSGGGGGFSSSSPYTQGSAGSGTTNQGYAGSVGFTSGSNTLGGGGGGAGAAGASTGTNYYGRAGGNGVAITGFATATGTGVNSYYAGGGGAQGDTGGGAGGLGGGGTGSTASSSINAGIANTGGGGAGGYTTGGIGGSGLVIIRYAK